MSADTTREHEDACNDDILANARRHAMSGEYMVARSLIESALNRCPDCVDALICKGNVIELEILDRERNRASGRAPSPEMKKARVCYERVLLLEPGNLTAMADLGDHWSYVDNFDKALVYYDRVIQRGYESGDERSVDAFEQSLNGKIAILESRGADEEANKLRALLPGETQ